MTSYKLEMRNYKLGILSYFLMQLIINSQLSAFSFQLPASCFLLLKMAL